jgi:anti-sigma regulatory factor (Ser/Thr protein kinase)
VDISLSAEKRQIGGLGIFLVQQMMDEVDYQRTPKGENVLVMKKKSS